MPPEWVTIAELRRPRGNKGEIAADSLSDVEGRFERLREAYLFRGDVALGKFSVEQAWWHLGDLVLKFRGFDSISDAEKLSGCEVRVPFSERAELEQGAYYQTDLIGAELVDASTGQAAGKVTGWQDLAGRLLLEIDGDWLVPYTPAICREVDVVNGRIVADLPEGLRDVNRL